MIVVPCTYKGVFNPNVTTIQSNFAEGIQFTTDLCSWRSVRSVSV